MTDATLEEQLEQLIARIERLERMAYVAFEDIRRVAEYTYQMVIRPPDEPGETPIRRMSHMRPLSESEAARQGLGAQHQMVLKSIWKALGFGIRHDAMIIAKDIATRVMAKADEPVAEPHEVPQS